MLCFGLTPQQHVDVAQAEICVHDHDLLAEHPRAIARFAATFVLPTPPLPLATAMVFTYFLLCCTSIESLLSPSFMISNAS